jgi:arylformamidase
MASTLIDISVPIRERMPIYDRNPGVRLERALSIPRGDTANVSRLELGVHTGTHLDAPLHFFEGGADAESLPLEPLVGRAYVADATALHGPIDADSLRSCGIPDDADRVLLKTPNGRLWERDDFTRDFIRLNGDGARLVVERGIRLIGIDYLSIGDEEAHRVLLDAGVLALEGLDLRHVMPGWYELLCLPLRVPGSDGAPARAVLRVS